MVCISLWTKSLLSRDSWSLSLNQDGSETAYNDSRSFSNVIYYTKYQSLCLGFSLLTSDECITEVECYAAKFIFSELILLYAALDILNWAVFIHNHMQILLEQAELCHTAEMPSAYFCPFHHWGCAFIHVRSNVEAVTRYNIPRKTHVKLGCFKISSPLYSYCNCLIILKFYTEHGSDTAMLCVKFQNNLTSEIDTVDEWDFMRFDFKISLGGIFYIVAVIQAGLHHNAYWWAFPIAINMWCNAARQDTSPCYGNKSWCNTRIGIVIYTS